MASSSAASPSGIPGVQGTCGYQNGNAPCFSVQGMMLCCSENGFCGSDETYCLAKNGCQYGCLPECAFASPPCSVSASSLSSTGSTASGSTASSTGTANSRSASSTRSSSTSSGTALSSSSSKHHKSGLSGGAIAGIVIGVILGLIILIALLSIILSRFRRKKTAQPVAPANKEESPVAATPPPPPPPVGPNLRQTANPFDQERNYGEIPGHGNRL